MYTNDTERLFAEGGMNDEGGTVDPVSGNEVPPGSLQNEVRDDIDAKLSEGEFVIPADVVRYIGLERLMKLRDEAKQGLARMAEIGQMGNADQVANPEALHEGDDGFEAELDSILQEVEGGEKEEKEMAEGGFVDAGTDYLAKYNIPKTSITNPALDVRAYKNAEGRVMYITFFNGKPSIAIPAGYESVGSAGQFLAEVKKTDDTKKDDVVTATQTIESGGDGATGVSGASVSTGQGIGASPVGIAIGAIANAIESITNPNPVVSIAEDSIGPEGSANAAAAAANAAAVAAGLAAENSIQGDEGSVDGMDASAVASAVDDASISEGVSQGDSTNGEGDSGDGGGDSGDGGGGGGGAMAKGGLVAKRMKKPTPARKTGIASKR